MTIDQKALLPCPFCGAAPDIFVKGTQDTGFWWTVECNDKCLAVGPMNRTEAGAVFEWNRRALPASGHAGLVEKFEKVIAEEADEYAADSPEAIERGERPDLWEREVTIPVAWLREAATALSAGVRMKGLEEAARNLINSRFDTYKARNGRRMSIEADDGEKCWIVHFDEMHELELALSALSDAPVVTEEMVERALVVWFDTEVTWDRGMAPQVRSRMVESMREALAAALGGE